MYSVFNSFINFCVVYYLYSIEGLHGIFKSVIPYVGANMLYRNIRNRLLLKNPYEPPRGEPPLCERFTEKNLMYFCRTRLWQLGSSVLALHAALPLRVLAVRTMARFVGDPEATQCPELPAFAFLREIFKYRSPCEVYAGSVAKTLREIFSAAISACVFLALMQAAHSFQLVIAPNQVDSFENAAESLANVMYRFILTFVATPDILFATFHCFRRVLPSITQRLLGMQPTSL